VVDDEVKMGVLTAGALEDAGHQVTRTDKGERALSLLAKQKFDIVITDLKMSPINGLTVLKEAKERNPDTEVILMTAYATAETAVQAMKAGAADYLIKPFSLDELVMLVERQLVKKRLSDQVEVLSNDLARFVPGEIIGTSAAIRDVLSMIGRVAKTDAGVLITGESGTGKELVARAIHARSPRGAGPFVAINCAALPDTLLESELFGHERGAFTGAVQRKRGRFELAEAGTLFLDEVGEIPLAIQVKLLRALEERSFIRVGGTTPIAVNARLVAATNRDLLAGMHNGKFREDLFFRLNVFPIHVPPLRERRTDIPLLAEHFLTRHASQLSLSPRAQAALSDYEWPGNVRELRNVLERAVILTDGGTIEPEHLHLLPGRETRVRSHGEQAGMAGVEKQMILDALKLAGGNKTEAARELRITRRMLYSRMKKHGLEI
jgi:two-component system NtrC family response regulator